jgi:predicted RNase H-like nuclease (RuvC/YqgF family)
MSVGNIRLNKFREIWSGPAYRELRRRVFLDRSSMEKCKDCGIGFKLSQCGWFVESLDFNKQAIKEAEDLKHLKEQLQDAHDRSSIQNQKVILIEHELKEREEQISALTKQSQDANERAIELNRQINEMLESMGWQLMMKFHKGFVERVLPQKTRRRNAYDHGLKFGRSLIK